MNIRFTRTHSQMLYGLAILFMVYHHLYCVPARLSYEYYSLLDSVFSPGTEEQVAWFGKICVAIYAFISGYSYHIKNSAITDFLQIYKNIFKQCLSFLIKLWIVCVVFILVGLCAKVLPFHRESIVLWFLAISPNGEWWYARFYIVAMVIFPFLDAGYRIIQNLYPPPKIIPAKIAAFVVILFMAKVFCVLTGTSKYLLVVMIGYLAADWKIFDCVLSAPIQQRPIFRYPAACAILTGCILLRWHSSTSAADFEMDYYIILPFILSVVVLLENTKYLSKILCFIGKHSTYIWLTHTFFIYYYFQEFSMITRHSTLMFLQLLLVSIATSIVLQTIEKIVYLCLNYLNRRFISWDKSLLKRTQAE